MPFGTREKDTGERVPATRFGIMGDPDAHEDPKKVNPVTVAPVSPAPSVAETPAPTDDKKESDQ